MESIDIFEVELTMITVSPPALTQLKALMAQQSEGEGGQVATKVALRVYVEAGGCSGFSYGMGLDENEPRPDDQVIEVEGGIRVLVDAFSAPHLEGAEIDYADALMGGGFTIHNPNAVKTCGCGSSFQTADGEGEAKSCSSH